MNIIKCQAGVYGVLALVAVLSGCGSGGGGGGTTAVTCGTPSSAALPVTTVSSTISAPATWAADNVYYVSTSINVNAALTIEPGAVVKFATGVGGGANLIVGAAGSITANGNSSKSIVFTSYTDDSVGGDSNGDAAATAPAIGDWGKIAVASNGSQFNCVQFKYGGKTNSTLDIGYGYSTGYTATITNSTFAHNNGGNASGVVTTTLSSEAHGALDASLAGTATVITGNIFYDNNVPLSVSGKFSIDDSNSFHDPADLTVKNKYNGIFHTGQSSKPFSGSITYAETEVPFVFAGYIDVPSGSQLTLSDNVIVKFFDNSSSLNTNYTGAASPTASIIANASAGNKIVFTSYKDDAHGGDTNGDGASSGAVGDWARIVLRADGSVFNRAEFYYGGWDTANRETLNLTTYSATITNSTFVYNHGDALSSLPSVEGVVNASAATAATVITGNTFYNNVIPLRISSDVSLDDSNVFHNPANTAQTNTYNGIFFTGQSANDIHTVSWGETEVPFVIQGEISVPLSYTLTLADNVVLKFASTSSRLTLYGSVTNLEGAGVALTSILDDLRKGDTNGDGTSSGATGDWKGVRDGNTSGLPYLTKTSTYFNLCNASSLTTC